MANDFDVQLCNEWDGRRLPARAILECKLDGGRALLVIAGGKYCCYSRNGNLFNNVGHIAAELKAFDGWVLDGEIVGRELGDKGWGQAMSAVKKAECGDTSASYIVFDVISAAEFDARKSTKTLAQRKAILKAKFPKGACFSGMVKSFPVKTAKQVEKHMKEFVKAGFEGAVLKDLDAPYEFKRSSAWLKLKPYKEADWDVVGYIEGKGKYKGMLGKLIVSGPDGVESGVGTGFSDEQRAEFWKKRKKMIGKKVQVKFQGVSIHNGLRFPSFMRIKDGT
jgi:DNA ligase-1